MKVMHLWLPLSVVFTPPVPFRDPLLNHSSAWVGAEWPRGLKTSGACLAVALSQGTVARRIQIQVRYILEEAGIEGYESKSRLDSGTCSFYVKLVESYQFNRDQFLHDLNPISIELWIQLNTVIKSGKLLDSFAAGNRRDDGNNNEHAMT